MKTETWTKYGKSARYYIWKAVDADGAFYNVTVGDFPPSCYSGYKNLEALLELKNEYGGYAPIERNL